MPQLTPEQKAKHNPDELYDFIEEESTCTITCSNCNKYRSDFGYASHCQEDFFKRGWRATKDNVYCPTCAPKKLKL